MVVPLIVTANCCGVTARKPLSAKWYGDGWRRSGSDGYNSVRALRIVSVGDRGHGHLHGEICGRRIEACRGDCPDSRISSGNAITCQVTPVLLEPFTVAWNCCVPADATVAEVGEMAIDTTGLPPPPPLLCEPPPQPARNKKPITVKQSKRAADRPEDMEPLNKSNTFVEVDEQQHSCVASQHESWVLRLWFDRSLTQTSVRRRRYPRWKRICRASRQTRRNVLTPCRRRWQQRFL